MLCHTLPNRTDESPTFAIVEQIQSVLCCHKHLPVMRLSHVIGLFHAVSRLWRVLRQEVEGRAVEPKASVLAAEAESVADETHAVDA